jgi:predicted component of viral defense system (DUF524 family)
MRYTIKQLRPEVYGVFDADVLVLVLTGTNPKNSYYGFSHLEVIGKVYLVRFNKDGQLNMESEYSQSFYEAIPQLIEEFNNSMSGHSYAKFLEEYSGELTNNQN